MKLTTSSSSSHFPIHQTNDHDHHHPFHPNRSSCHFFFDSTQDHQRPDAAENYEHQSIKWMSSKMRLMQKMKTTDIHDDQKLQMQIPSSSSDLSSNSSSYNNTSSPIRVCSDCNTTKTPLWRSGPKGPKSLCNACGIRQRKARRAMAAAIANTTSTAAAHQTTKIKLQHKGKTSAENGLSSHLNKRCKTTTASIDNNKLGFEDFLINLSKIHRVFPDDEKDAAILLMAISSGLVNG